MSQILEGKFKEQAEEHVENFPDVFKSKWDLVYEEENHDANVN